MFEDEVIARVKDYIQDIHQIQPRHREVPSNILISNNVITNLSEEVVRGNVKKVSLVVTDKTRPTPLRELLTMLLPNIWRDGVDAEVIFATGTHEMSLSDAINILGSDLGVRIHIHDAVSDPHTYLGDTAGGIPVELLSRVIESDAVILIGYVMPHPWSGFSGGAKLLLPGISSRGSISTHHLKYYSHPNTLPAVIDGNPFRAEIDNVGDVLSRFTNVYSINVVFKKDRNIYGTVGDLRSSYREAAALSHNLYVNTVSKPYDLLILDSRPLNMNIYQSVKAVCNNIAIAGKESLIVLIVEGRDGGPEEFINALRDDEDVVLSKVLRGGNIVPYILALYLRSKVRDKELVILTKNANVLMKSENIIITNNVNWVVNEVVSRYRLGCNAALIPQSAYYVNMLQGLKH